MSKFTYIEIPAFNLDNAVTKLRAKIKSLQPDAKSVYIKFIGVEIDLVNQDFNKFYAFEYKLEF